MPFGVSGPEQPPQQRDNIHGQDDLGKHVQHAKKVNNLHKLLGGFGEMLSNNAVQRCVLHLLELRRNADGNFQGNLDLRNQK